MKNDKKNDIKKKSEKELSEKELKEIAGGRVGNSQVKSRHASGCACASCKSK